jgi:ribose transport system substrate-binding protein
MKRFVLIATMLMTAWGCGGPAEAPQDGAPADKSAAAGEAKYTIAVVPKGLTHDFWKTVRAGADAAAAELDAKVVWNGPDKETEVAKQIDILQDMISSKVDGIVMAACDANALIDVINEAQGQGIPVVTIDSGVNSDAPVSFVATDNIAGAEAAARELAMQIGEQGEVGLIPFVAGAGTSEMREEGFKKGIAEYPNIQLVSTLYCDSDVAKALSATEDMMTSHPNLKGIFAANEPAAIGAAQAIASAGKTGQVKLIAFDASPEEINHLKSGSIQALIVQNPFKMGYDGVKAAIDHIEGRPVQKRIDTGVNVVTSDRLEEPDVQRILNPLDFVGE